MLSQIPTEIDIFVFALPEFRKVKKKKKSVFLERRNSLVRWSS